LGHVIGTLSNRILSGHEKYLNRPWSFGT